MSQTQAAYKSIPEMARQGIPNMVGTPKVGVGLQNKKITLVGAAPHTVVFATEGLSDMADTSYCVLVGGETAGPVTVDESTMTTTGFNLLGGVNGEVAHVVVIGRLKGQISA